MTTDAPANDPLYTSLNQLVVAGQLAPEEAQAALDAVRRADRAPRVDQVLIAAGSAFVFAAILISTFRSRGQGDIDWSNYVMGLAGTLGLLGVAAAAYLLVSEQPLKSNLMAWPGAFGALGAGLMIGIAMDDGDATAYVSALAIVGLSAGGYWLIRRGAFLVSALVGLAMLYAQLYDDLFGFDDLEGDNFAMSLAAVIAVFTIVVTLGGWFLPETRALTGVLAGIVSVVGLFFTMVGLVVFGVVSGFFSGLGSGFEDGGGRPKREDAFDNDVWMILLIAAVLCVGWAACAWQTGHMGFRLLIVAMVTAVVPLSTFALAVQHPTWWELVVGLAGAAALGYAAVRALGGLDVARTKLTTR